MRVSGFACDVSDISTSFLFMVGKYSIVWIYHNPFNQSGAIGHVAIVKLHC